MSKQLRDILALAILSLSACKPSDVLTVPPPLGVAAASSLANQTGAELAFNGGKVALFQALAGPYGNNIIGVGGLFADEFSASNFTSSSPVYLDARMALNPGGSGATDNQWMALLNARSELLVAVPGLIAYEPSSGQSKVGEDYALVGYAELFLGEDFCGGTTLDEVLPGGGIQYAYPLSADSLLALAVSHFDSALAHAAGSTTVSGFASVGLGRALMDRGLYSSADTAVGSVPTNFVYNMEFSTTPFGAPNTPSLYVDAIGVSYYRNFLVSDREGENGLNFISAGDPRLHIDSSLTTYDGLRWYFPIKFETNLSHIPLATGIEARLIEAEAALEANQPTTWAADLSALRADVADTHVTFDTSQVPIKTDSTSGASSSSQIDMMFRERAFWLFGTGTRLGDLRRLVRQYGRNPEAVYPTGPYSAGPNNMYAGEFTPPVPSYGTDVVFSIPVLSTVNTSITNPHYKGCLESTKTA